MSDQPYPVDPENFRRVVREILVRLESGPVRIAFEKSDGSIRTMRATRRGCGFRNWDGKSMTIQVRDLAIPSSRRAVRSFRLDRLLKFEPDPGLV